MVFSPLLKQTRMATEAHYLLMRYAFEQLGYRRYEWKCDSCNQPSYNAALRLGFRYEGTFRQVVVYKIAAGIPPVLYHRQRMAAGEAGL